MSDSLVLDTDVASYLFKNSPHAKPFRTLLKGKRLALAFVSVAELFKWTLKSPLGPAKSRAIGNGIASLCRDSLRPRHSVGLGTSHGRM